MLNNALFLLTSCFGAFLIALRLCETFFLGTSTSGGKSSSSASSDGSRLRTQDPIAEGKAVALATTGELVDLCATLEEDEEEGSQWMDHDGRLSSGWRKRGAAMAHVLVDGRASAAILRVPCSCRGARPNR